MIDPVIDALTRSMSPALRAKMPMISSAAFPSVAFISPPIVAPVRAASSSVAVPMRPASGTIAAAATKKTRTGGEWSTSRAIAATTSRNRAWRGLSGTSGAYPDEKLIKELRPESEVLKREAFVNAMHPLAL